MATALGGLDTIVFTGGIGQNSAPIREKICKRLGWLGIELSPTANCEGSERISAAGSRSNVRVIPTDEEAVIAKHTAKLMVSAEAFS